VPDDLPNVANNSGVQGYYAYDGLGRRVEAEEGTSTVFYGYLETETLAEGSTNPYTDYIYSNSLRIARVTGANVGGSPSIFYFHTDALGSTRLVTDTNKNVLFTNNYQPYGQDNQSTGSETYKFTGKPYSVTTGLYYYFQRRCDPSIRRFISVDLAALLYLIRKLVRRGGKKIARMVTNPVGPPMDDRLPPNACHP